VLILLVHILNVVTDSVAEVGQQTKYCQFCLPKPAVTFQHTIVCVIYYQ